jgi:hypothetical protein
MISPSPATIPRSFETMFSNSIESRSPIKMVVSSISFGISSAKRKGRKPIESSNSSLFKLESFTGGKEQGTYGNRRIDRFMRISSRLALRVEIIEANLLPAIE